MPVEHDATLGPNKTHHGFEQCGLASAVRSEHGNQLATADIERNAVQSFYVTVKRLETINAKDSGRLVAH